ncbi:hypothetical protein GGI20_003371 [Coemansia sp. BCRC 34301]|nr:hypothetical protein GGI20_003371 [Coemansia sp. BCRC 34301]
MYAPPAKLKEIQVQSFRVPTTFVPDYVDLRSLQKCLEDRRSDFLPASSVTFNAELELEKRPYQQFLVLERDHFALFSHYYSPVKFSYQSRNAVMSRLWSAGSFPRMSATKFVEVDGLWQLEQLPVLYLVFGKDADTLCSDYLIDGNTIVEYYESAATMDMAELAAVAQSKAALCVSHFFVVNRGKNYWAVDTSNSSVSYAFGPSTKTSTISRLADGSTTIQALIDDEQPLPKGEETHTSQRPTFKLYDANGEEIAEGERFALHIQRGRDNDDGNDDEDTESERRTMFDGKDWLGVFNRTNYQAEDEAVVHGAADYGAYFGLKVVGGKAYLTYEDQFLQIGSRDYGMRVVVLPQVPPVHKRIHISITDNGNIVLSQWGTKVPIVCEWVKLAYAVVMVRTLDDPTYPRRLLRLRAVKI